MAQHISFAELSNLILMDQSISTIIDCSVDDTTPKHANLSSEIIRFKLNVILYSGKITKMSIVVKTKGSKLARLVENLAYFKREIKVYKDILPKFEQLMNEYGDYNDKLWTNMIGYQTYVIILEDLKTQLYKIVEGSIMLDMNHVKLVMHSLGRFHAWGHVLLQKKLIYKQELPQHIYENDSIYVTHFIESAIEQLSSVMNEFWPPEWKQVAERLMKEKDKCFNKRKDLFKIQENCFLTVCHGDLWTNNILFKYCPYDESLPVSLKFIDYQTSHMNSYIFDLMYSLHLCVHPENLGANLDDLLSVYLKSLKSTLSTYGMEEHAPSLLHVHAEAERIEYFIFSIYVSNLAIIASTCENNLDLTNLKSESNKIYYFNPEIFKNEFYISIVREKLKLWMNKGLF